MQVLPEIWPPLPLPRAGGRVQRPERARLHGLARHYAITCPICRPGMAGVAVEAERTGAAGAGGQVVVVSAAVRVRAGQLLAAVLDRYLCRARDAAQARAAGKSQLRTIARVRSRGLRPRAPAKRTRNDVVGLVGEIMAEGILRDLGAGEPFYAKWRSSGTSVSSGVDLVFKKADSMSANESEHLHDSIGNARTPVTPVAHELNRSLARNTDAHTKDFFGSLCLAEEGHAAECDARGDEAGRMRSRERQRALEKVLETGAYTTNAVIVFDDAHSPSPAAVLSRTRLAAAESLKKPVTGFLAGVRDLRDSTASMIGRYAQ